jgi:hypothetical protein
MEEILSSTLKKYQFSRNVDVLFCGTCSTTMFFSEHFPDKPQSIGVFLGALLNHEEPGLIKIVDHIFVGDTLDGGATPWLINVNADGTPARRWKGARNKSDELDGNWPPLEDLMTSDDKTGPETFAVHCHCRGVNLVLRRGDSDFSSQQKARARAPWFVDPQNWKHICKFDACNSCRGMFGIDLVHWTFVLVKHLDFAPNGKELDGQEGFPQDTISLKQAVLSGKGDPRLGTLAFFESSPDVQRYFCSNCSASVFYAVDDRPDMVDLAAGLLVAPEGARAESLLTWDFGSSIGNLGDVKGGWREDFMTSVQRNAEAWRIERGYPKSFQRKAAEENKAK